MNLAPGGGGMMNTPSAESALRHHGRDAAFFGAAAVVFGIAAAATIRGSQSMSMPWMRMPGQTWPGVAAGFLSMWVLMMVAMMLPSLVPMLWRYRRALGGWGEARLGRLTTLVALAYFCVWAAFGVGALALGVARAAIETRIPAVGRALPLAVAVLLVIAGLFQFSAWKAHHLACCRTGSAPERRLRADAKTAWRHGLKCGLHCSCSCAGLTAVLLGLGVMDLRVMALVMLATTAERLAPAGERFARAIGAIAVAAGLLLIARA
jgi:predicted metal-binding membrane protein